MDYEFTKKPTMSKQNLKAWSELNDDMWGEDLQEVLAGHGYSTVFEDVFDEDGLFEETIIFTSFGPYENGIAGFERFMEDRWETLRELVEDNLDSFEFIVKAGVWEFRFSPEEDSF